jgi:glutaredoxin/glutathione-dependent peroxiredoxin
MAIAIGERIPDVKLKTVTEEGVRDVSTAELFRGKKAVLFGVPGAFTGTCSTKHLPGFVELADEIKARGVDLVACTAVNDIHVLRAWGREHGTGDKIALLADGNGDLARAMGLEIDLRSSGLGIRSQRYAAILEDGVIRSLETDVPGEVTGSGAAAVLRALRALGAGSQPAARGWIWPPASLWARVQVSRGAIEDCGPSPKGRQGGRSTPLPADPRGLREAAYSAPTAR